MVKLWPKINEYCFWYLDDGKEVAAWTSAWHGLLQDSRLWI
jgi:hypothetical protein